MDISLPPCFSLITKEESDNNLLEINTGCCVCGEEHETEKCSIFDNLIHVKDKKVPPRALLTIPPNLRLETLADGSKTIIAEKVFAKGIQFGPYEAKRLYAINPFDIFPLKIFGDSENVLPLPDCYLDTKNEEHCNWLCYVAAANNLEEQNLICYQLKNDIFYSVIRDIQPGEQLKVWYSSYYASKIGVKLHSPKKITHEFLDDAEKIQEVAEKLPPNKLGVTEVKQNWCCKFCSHIESNIVKFAKHLQKHYKKMIENFFNCDICNAGFSTKNLLKKHLRTVHIVFTGIGVNDKQDSYPSYKSDCSKIDLIETCMPLPIDNLINETLADSDPNLLMLDQLNSGLYNDLNDVDALRAILCDDNTKASKIAQEKSIADFSLELVESNEIPKMQMQPPFTCDICDKSFQNLDYLHRHLSKHTGEFTCIQCLEVFTRKENYIRHPCLIAKNCDQRFNCPFCQKIFLQNKYLRRHMRIHLDKYLCNECGKEYNSLTEKNEHNCASIPDDEKNLFNCTLCEKRFTRKAYLQKHIRRFHKKTNKEETKHIICEICAETFKNVKVLKSHILSHSEPKFECNICNKKFHKPYVYQNHMMSHGTAKYTCEYCPKKFKTKKGQLMHMVTHKQIKPFSCNECGQNFRQRVTLELHAMKEHNQEAQKCTQCNQTFSNKYSYINHLNFVHNKNQGDYKCTVCGLKFLKQFLLKRHMNFKHSNKIYVCQYCNHSFKQRSSMRRHLNKVHLENKEEWNDPSVISSFLVDANVVNPLKNTNNLDNNNETSNTVVVKDNNVDSVNTEDVNLNENEVLLSLPVTEYTEITDQQITLGKNAFILEDGTIVQPQPEGNLMFYVINQ